jgi:nucleotide-binding universal stress UspA family protein
MAGLESLICTVSSKAKGSNMKTILAAVDGSAPSYRALEQAALLSKALGADLVVLLVRQFIVGRHDVLEVWTNEQVSEIRKLIGKVVSESGTPSHRILEEHSRDVAYAIVEAALSNHVDLIVMGASGMGSIKAFILGSVSNSVLRQAACPVMIVH